VLDKVLNRWFSVLLQYGRPLYGDVFGVQQPESVFYEVWNRAYILGNSGFKDAVED
jgi:hypothetical protein